MKAVLFDLDNTLYPEIEFVKSGFRAVARYLVSKHHFSEDLIVKQMLDILEKDGRGKVFDSSLHNLGLYSEDMVKLLVFIYRSHHPRIQLYSDVLPTLKKLRSWSLRMGIITDGMASVQRNKIASLAFDKIFDAIVFSDEIGREFWKPSTMPYKVALNLLQISPLESAYVGDDPSKDFLGSNSIGMYTIQVKREMQQNKTDVIPEPARARVIVKKLDEILPIIKEKRNAW